MPKERLHLLLADESLRLLKESNACVHLHREAYLLGAICPDVFFYDLPFFRLGSVGRGLHRFEGEAAVDFFGSWLQEKGGTIEPDTKSWMLGFVGHLLADGLLHPAINGFCRRFSAELNLTARDCHHWLESELESHWLAVTGPADGYLPLLKRFTRRDGKKDKYLRCFRTFLMRAELADIPSEARIRRCLAWQTCLLRLFAGPKWRILRPWLLRARFSKSLGVLFVPQGAVVSLPGNNTEQHRQDYSRGIKGHLPSGAAGARSANGSGPMDEPWLMAIKKICEPDYMAETISRLTTRLLELLRHF